MKFSDSTIIRRAGEVSAALSPYSRAEEHSPRREPCRITPLVLTYNEAPNIGRVLAKLQWAERVVVLDSFSKDETARLASQYSRTAVFQRLFDDHSSQWNFGVSKAGSDWILALDADYVLSDDLVDELQNWSPAPDTVAYYASFRYCICGKPLRACLYPPRAVLFNRRFCRYEQDGHTQVLRINGGTGRLNEAIDHDDRKPLSHWLWAQDRYAKLEVEKLLGAQVRERAASGKEEMLNGEMLSAGGATIRPEESQSRISVLQSAISTNNPELSIQDRIRKKVILAPILVLFYTLFWKRLILDGWPGWYYVCQRVAAEMILSLRLIEAKLERTEEHAKACDP